MGEYILETKHIRKKYKGSIILNDLNIKLKKGEIYGLIGKNGCGKTTLFRIITGLIPRFDGKVMYSMQERISASIDSPALFLNLSAMDNMIVQNKLSNLCTNEELIEILKKVGLDYRSNKAAKYFSLGMSQRLRIALCLLSKPSILILDEPLNGLDPEGVIEFRNILKNLNRNQNMTILISSHILSELECIATRYGILANGKIVKEFSRSEILENNINLEQAYIEVNREVKSR